MSVRRIILLLTLALVCTPFVVAAGSNSQARAGIDGWDAGNIVSDSVFTNKSSMSPDQIQLFLSSKVTSCDTSGTRTATEYGSSLTHAQYAASQGWSAPPYTCLKDYSENGNSAAQIIYAAAQQYSINPQVLIVLLQKEQGLVTDTWPLSSQYRKATGYGCPDSGSCDSAYYGLTNQVNWAAKMFRAIMNASPSWYTPYIVGNNYIRYNPSTSCGGSSVTIQNRATQALYNYTPYQPNQSALDAGWGTGNSCGSYGNRNFYLYFTGWFSSTQIAANYNPYIASYVSQSSYPSLAPGSSATVSIRYQNQGALNWYDSASAPANNAPTFTLGTAGPANRSSVFGSSWGGDQNRATNTFATVYKTNGQAYTTNPHTVQPGESVDFSFTVSAPANKLAGTYREYFAPVAEGYGYSNASTVFLDVTVESKPQATYKAQSSYPLIQPGTAQTAWIEFTNSGNTVWYDDTAIQQGLTSASTKPVHLSTASPNNRASIFGVPWGGDQNRATNTFATVYKTSGEAYTTNPHAVQPGESARFSFNLTAPDNQPAGQFTEYFQPIVEGGSPWDMGASAWLQVTVPTAATARPSTSSLQVTVQPATQRTLGYSFINTGNTTWTPADTTLVVTGSGVNTILANTSTTLNESSVSPGQTGTFSVTATAPGEANSYSLTAQTKTGSVITSTSGTSTTIAVPAPIYAASYVSQSEYPVAYKNSTYNGWFRFKNTGTIAWFKQGAPKDTYTINLATQSSINRESVFGALWGSDRNRPTGIDSVYNTDGSLATDQTVVNPGQIAEFSFTFTIPQSAQNGTYREWFTPIAEGRQNWYMDANAFLDVTVRDTTFAAQYAGQSDYPTIQKGTSKAVYFKFKNTGTATWVDAAHQSKDIRPTVLATGSPINRQSIFLSGNRPATDFSQVYMADGVTLSADQTKVQPGQIAQFTFTLVAPNTATVGTYREWFTPIIEGGSPAILNANAFLDVTVR